MQMYPLKFQPIYKQRIWGGQRLRELFGKDLPTGEKIGESWELSDLPEDKSVIINGPLNGLTLNQAIQKYPEQITGSKNFNLPFPLLIKFLDAQQILSLQVHPDPQTCKRLKTGDPKTECWYVFDAPPGAFIYKGLMPGVTRRQFEQAVKNSNVENLLQKVYVQKGQCYYLPAGTVHSLGPGLLIAEIQTPSDTTYRVFDFNRLDQFGKHRPLHIPQALESIHFDNPDNLPVTTAGTLLDCEFFRVHKDSYPAGAEIHFQKGQMKILIFLTGLCIFKSSLSPDFRCNPGLVALLPADCDADAVFENDAEFLTVTI
jgi:mannose-6-phosphate isomerase